MAFPRFGIITLAVLTLLAPLGCRRFQRRCDPPARDALPAPREEFDPGVIPPRGSTIPPPGVPDRPEFGRQDTFTPTRPAPRLESPLEPFLPSTTPPSSPFDLPRPTESESWKLPESDEPTKPKKLILIPEQMPDSPDAESDPKSESKFLPDDSSRPTPDRKVLRDPVAPGGDFNLPRTGPEVVEERAPSTRESKASPRPDTPPVGVPGYEPVVGQSNLASGRRPTNEGFDWLAKSGYQTVVYAHEPAADVAGVKAVCQAAGLKFVGIPTAADNMSEAVAAFNAAVAGAADGPVYVCDDAGLRAATLWYAHFRMVDLLSPDTATVRATRLGLGDTDANTDQRRLWLAVNDLLAKR